MKFAVKKTIENIRKKFNTIDNLVVNDEVYILFTELKLFP